MERTESRAVKVWYKNYRGEVALRTIVPLTLWFGATEWHPERQWFVKAFDQDRHADRDFALADFVGGDIAPFVPTAKLNTE